jgi:biopolymer transport protein ExbD
MKPIINVTPLIDILLVLLIIFMVISPITPSQFETRIPSERKIESDYPNINTLIVRISSDSSLALNNEYDLGTISEPTQLSQRLNQIFRQRIENKAFDDDLLTKENLKIEDKIQRTVFIKAPKSLPYGDIVRVIDEIKIAGANPISLQIDDLEF